MQDERSPLIGAIEGRYTEAIQLLIDNEADVNKSDRVCQLLAL